MRDAHTVRLICAIGVIPLRSVFPLLPLPAPVLFDAA